MNARHYSMADRDLVTITLADGTVLPGCRPDLFSIADLMARGWSVIPLKPKSKIAAVKWEAYQHRLATLDELEAWFTLPGFNVGIVTGTISKLFVVDAASADAMAWAQEHLPPCELRVRTAKGLHLYYPFSGERSNVLEGMQPQYGHSPPTSSRSTTASVSPLS